MTKRFLIECECGNTFWRAYPCNPKTLRTYDCPKGRPYGPYFSRPHAEHLTRLTDSVKQALAVIEYVRSRPEGSKW